MGKRLSLYKNSALRGVKWEKGDVMIEVLNKTTFAFYIWIFFVFQNSEKVKLRGVKLFIILASSYFAAGPPLQYRHRSRV